MTFTESVAEDATLGWLESLDYAFFHGLDVAPICRSPCIPNAQWR